MSVVALNTNIANLSVSEMLQRAETLELHAAEYRREAARPTTHPADVADLREAAAEADGAAIYLRRIATRGNYA